MTSTIKVNTVTTESGCTVTLGESGKNVVVANNDIRSNTYKAADGGVIASQSGTTITLGASGDTIALASGASQTGFGRTGTVDWQTGSIKTSTFTAANGEGYFANTSGGPFTMNLPAGSAGAIVSVVDYTNTFQTNNLTIAANGSEKIGGVAATTTLSTEGQSVTLVYVDGTEGWKNVQDSTSNITGTVPYIVASGGTESTCGDFKIHKFTGPGTFSVTAASTVAPRNGLEYLVVAGGGGGRSGNSGSARGGGGGGAGGYRTSAFGPSPLQAPTIPASAGSFPITVGAGGAGAASQPQDAVSGSPSVFPAPTTITSAGGGFGGGNVSGNAGTPGGSGGGAGDGPGGGAPGVAGGTGNTPPVSPPQGNNGGPRESNPNNNGGGGSGGGGAGAAGSSGQVSSSYPRNGGAGGSGVPNTITGSDVTYAVGGDGGPTAPFSITNGADNTGDGGDGGGGNYPPSPNVAGGNGGSGIVVIRYRYQN